MTNVGVVEVIVRSNDDLLEADPNPHPSDKLLDLDSPLCLDAYIVKYIPVGSGSSISANRCPLDSIPDCSAII